MVQRLPPQFVIGLLFQRQMAQVVRVDEKMPSGFIVRDAALEEFDMPSGDLVRVRAAVGIEGLAAAVPQPVAKTGRAAAHLEEHLVMVAQDRHKTTSVAQGDKHFDGPRAVGAAVHIVAQRDERVVAADRNRLEERP
jgi:hypothetical protein